MPTITISLPSELKKRLEKHPEVNWSEVFRRSFAQKVKELEEFEAFKKRGG